MVTTTKIAIGLLSLTNRSDVVFSIVLNQLQRSERKSSNLVSMTLYS